MADIYIDTAALGDLTVIDDESKEIPLSEFWQKRTAVLVFVRHFG